MPWALGRRGGGADLPAGDRARHHLLGHRQHLRTRQLRGDRRPRHQDVHPPRRRGAGHEALPADARRPRWRRAVPAGRDGAGRRVAGPARHRLHRPLPDPPLRPATPRSRRRWRRCTTSSRPARSATSALRRCGRGSSPPCSTPPTCTAGPGSSPCRTSTACCTARRSGRCSACSPTRVSAPSRGARWPPAGSPARGVSRAPSGRQERRRRHVRPAAVPATPTPAIVDAVAADRRDPRRVDGPGRSRLGAAQPGRQRADRRSTKPHHLSDAVAALDLELTDDEVTALEQHYQPRHPTYFR